MAEEGEAAASSSSSSCQDVDDGASNTTSYGIMLVLGSCVCYALGNCLQRYSLLKADWEKVLYILHKQVGWLLGALIYFSANGLYAVALTYAPVSVLAAVFSLTIVANAVCARFMLGDQVTLAAIPGYVMVLTGSIVFSVSVQAAVCGYTPAGIITVMTSGIAIVYWLVAGIFLSFGLAFTYYFERTYPWQPEDQVAAAAALKEVEMVAKDANHPGGCFSSSTDTIKHAPDFVVDNQTMATTDYQRHPSPSPSLIGMVATTDNHNHNHNHNNNNKEIPMKWNFAALIIYPSTLGILEAAGALLLNGINALFTHISNVDNDDEPAKVTVTGSVNKDEGDDEKYIGLWVGLYGVGIVIFAGIVLFLRLVYRRYEITAAFPTEFGVLTFGSVVGGFLVYQDFRFLNNAADVLFVLLACALILGGIAVVGLASWRKQQQQQQQHHQPSPHQSSTKSNDDAAVVVQEEGVLTAAQSSVRKGATA
jgi:hypothetical protein